MVLCFGEILLRFAPDAGGIWLDQSVLDVYTAGSELNVASALAKWKVPVCYLTALPDNFLSKELIKKIKQQDIDVSTIIHHGNKIGLYYLMQNKNNHPNIIYDKAHSSFYELKPGMINWDNVLQGIRWFHFNITSPTLNEDIAAVYTEALQACAKKSITVSVDLNFYPDNKEYEKLSKDIIPQFLPYCDVVAGNIWLAASILNIKLLANIETIYKKEDYLSRAKKISEEMMKQFPRCKIIANTFRFHKPHIEYYAALYINNNIYGSASYETDTVTDEVGSIDCFMAGLIYGIYNHLPFQQLINFASGAAFQKLFIKGSSAGKTADEVRSFILNYHK